MEIGDPLHWSIFKTSCFYSVYYIAKLLKNLGFSYQKARFFSDHLDDAGRRRWLEQTWPGIRELSRQRGGHILFGDEASFPQWGSLSYTWAPRGEQPTVKTSGKRKGYKVFGMIEFWSGKFFSKAIEGRFTSETYAAFVTEVMSKTRKHLIIVQDGARYHTSKYMRAFFAKHADRVTTFQLPSYYSPQEKDLRVTLQETAIRQRRTDHVSGSVRRCLIAVSWNVLRSPR